VQETKPERQSFIKTGFKRAGDIFVSELKLNTTPEKAARSFSLGIFFGIFPIFGFQTVAAVLAARLLRLNMPIAVFGSVVLFPFMVPIVFAAIWIGLVIFTSTNNVQGFIELFSINKFAFLVESGKYFITGCILLSASVPVLAYLVAYPICRFLKKKI